MEILSVMLLIVTVTATASIIMAIVAIVKINKTLSSGKRIEHGQPDEHSEIRERG